MTLPLTRPAQLGKGRPHHRYLGHHRLAGQERSGQQRQGRDHRRLLRRLPHARSADRSASGARRRGADERDGRGLDRRRLVPQRRVPPDHGRVRLRADHRQGGRPQAPVRLPRSLPGVPRRRLGRRVRAQERSRSPAGLAPIGRASRLHRLLEAPGGRPGAAEGDARGADAPRARAVRSGGHLRPDPRLPALERRDTSNRNHIVLGPWHHGQQTREASSLGPLQWGADTGLYFRAEVLQPFWDEHLKGMPAKEVRDGRVLAFDTGDHRWREFDVWPPKRRSSAASSTCSRRAASPSPRRRPPRRPTPPLRSSPIPPSRCPIACRRSGRCGPRTRRGGAGWSTTNDRSPRAPTSWCSRASR